MAATFGCSVHAAVPHVINYQGKLQAGTEVVADSTYSLTFSIFNSPDQGTALWSETHPSVQVAGGLFAVVLGSVVPLTDSVFASPERWLEISVNGESIIPRTQVTSVAYSQRVSTVDGTTGGQMEGLLTIVPEGSGLHRPAIAGPSVQIGFGRGSSGGGSLDFYEPVDSKVSSPNALQKKIQIQDGSIVFFGLDEQDTTLIVKPNGDIVSQGQITMGENSSDGLETTVLGFANTANGDSSTIGGGSGNVTNGPLSTVTGGLNNTANGRGSAIGGGEHNTVDGAWAVVSGGLDNQAAGDYGAVPGGQENNADGEHSYAAGHRAKANHNGTFVWADQLDEDFASTGDDQFIIRARGGVGIGTNEPKGSLEVAGAPADSSVNLPENAIGSPEILDEPGVASTWASDAILLTQHTATVQQVSSVTITVPAAGFVIVRGLATLEAYGTSQRAQAYIQISESPSAGVLGPYSRQSGPGDMDSPGRQHYFDLSSERIFTVTPGTHTYVLEALAHPQNGNGAVTYIQRPQMSALFVPTAYGQIVGFSGDPLGGAARQVDWPLQSDSLSAAKTGKFYEVELADTVKLIP